MNWPVLILFGIAAIALISFLVTRNVKDEKKFEDDLKKDYRKPKAEDADVDIDETMK